MGVREVCVLRRTAVYMKTIAAVSSPAPFALQGDTCERDISIPCNSCLLESNENITEKPQGALTGSGLSVWCIALSAPTTQ